MFIIFVDFLNFMEQNPPEAKSWYLSYLERKRDIRRLFTKIELRFLAKKHLRDTEEIILSKDDYRDIDFAKIFPPRFDNEGNSIPWKLIFQRPTNHAPRDAYILVDIDGTNFAGMDLRGSRFDKLHGEGACFTQANLEGVVLSGSFKGAIFSNANLRGGRSSMAFLNDANFEGADCSGRDFFGSYMLRVKASGANFQRSRFNESLLGQHYHWRT